MNNLTQSQLLLASAAVSFSAGYVLASAIKSKSTKSTASKQVKPKAQEENYSESSGEETDSEIDLEPSKLVLVIRTDLGMTKGKVAAQCSHATLACYKKAVSTNNGSLRSWEFQGQPKITLKCDSEEEMLSLQTKAAEFGLIARHIQDAGRTQIAAGSRTVLGIGPGPISLINKVTGHLKLY